MSNPAYERGRRFEWERRDFWEAKGYIVTRAAGSKGAYDLVCVHPDSAHIVFEQCKVVEDEGKGERIAKAWRPLLPSHPNYSQQLIVKVHGKGVYIVVGGPSPQPSLTTEGETC